MEQKAIQKVGDRSPVRTLHEKRRSLPLPQDRADLSQVDALIDRLANRLGRTAVLRALPCETALPETQTRYAPALDLRAGDPASGWTAWQSPERLAGPALPVRLLEAPEPVEGPVEAPVEAPADAVPGRFAWRRRAWRVVADEGPARRLGRWWHGETAIRDYWQVAAVPAEASGSIRTTGIPDGAPPVRLWLYRDPAAGPANRWSVHGLMG